MVQTILYLKDRKGQLRYWQIESVSDGFEIEWGVVGGVPQREKTPVPYGKGSLSQKDQIASQVAAKIKKRKESGYRESIEEAEKIGDRGLNDLGLPRPMLAAKFNPHKHDATLYFQQPKLDGHRCLIYKSGQIVQAYSRNGKPIDSITEIMVAVADLPISEVILDGELYIHGTPLQKISSLVKRRQEDTAKVQYWVYDICDPQRTFEHRARIMSSLLQERPVPACLKMVPTTKTGDIVGDLHFIKNKGYEGLILRDPKAVYETGKRSMSLLKVKSCIDDEFQITRVLQGAKGEALFQCVAKNGALFSVTAPGPLHEKQSAWANRDLLIGKFVRVEFANYTQDGKPFHPVATMLRSKDDE